MPDFNQFAGAWCWPDRSPLGIDHSHITFPPSFLSTMEPAMQQAYTAMKELEGGAIANPDENRMVGHYWLRDFSLIPDGALRKQVAEDDAALRAFVKKVVDGELLAPSGEAFGCVLVVGIGGSALGPQLVADALSAGHSDQLKPFFLDNTDPEGVARVLDQLEGVLSSTLTVVISKSGGTPETRNGMLLAKEAYERAGLVFGPHAVAVTGPGSKMDQYAKEAGFLARLPMYDWVGGRTSLMSAVGLVPAALQGVDIDAFIGGARDMDVVTRTTKTSENPAALLALCWFAATNGKGEKDMVVLPYKDRLLLFSRYLQQLVMESLGKEKSLSGEVVHQGIAVYGNKGSTDQHAYVQQLRDGVKNFFAVFVEILEDGGSSLEVEPGVTAGDYLAGFLQGTRRALFESGRESVTIIAEKFDARTLGALVGLFERAVGFYATLVNINAYHQPGVEAGKKAAAAVLDDQKKLVAALANTKGDHTADEWATKAGVQPEAAFRILQHLAFNNRGVVMTGRQPSTAKFRAA